VLMEINGRYWGSYPLAVHCHADFALISYLLESGLGLPQLPPPRDRVRCRMVATEIKRLGRILFHPELIADKSFKIDRTAELLRFLADFFRPSSRYYVWAASDPLPFIIDAQNLVKKLRRR